MTLRSNQPMLFDWACWLTTVGLRLVSIGPPMSVSEAGRQGSSQAAISAAAASTGTDGWQTATTWVPVPMNRMHSITWSMKSSRSKRPQASGTWRASRQSVM